MQRLQGSQKIVPSSIAMFYLCHCVDTDSKTLLISLIDDGCSNALDTDITYHCRFATCLHAGICPHQFVRADCCCGLASLPIPLDPVQCYSLSVLSPFRYLPTPKVRNIPSTQTADILFTVISRSRSLFLGSLKSFSEFSGETARRFVEEVPNNRPIRYYISGNLERLLITSPDALSEVLVQRPYDFAKPDFVRKALSVFAGTGLPVAEGEDHKASTASPIFVLLTATFNHIHNAKA